MGNPLEGFSWHGCIGCLAVVGLALVGLGVLIGRCT
jgi:hypothetical protein